MNFSKEQILDSHDDLFDSLPDEIVLSIFKKLHDAKSLCRSMSVCKRFQSIAPQIDEIFLSIPHKKALVKQSDQQNQKGLFKNRVFKALFKPLHFISQMIKSKPKNEEEQEEEENDQDLDFFHIPNEVLKSFEEIRSLHLKLPCHGTQKLCSKTGDSDKNSFTFLKWRAEFGKELHSCVILGAKSLTDQEQKNPDEKNQSEESRLISDEELKLRIVWTISCLIAASARHCLVQETVKRRKTIESVTISDESEQGRLCMNKKQIEELREMNGKGEEEDDDESMLFEFRSRVPCLRMKMWYLERLELSESWKVMEGATLVVISPAVGGAEDGDFATTSFCEEGDEVVEEAMRKLMVAKKCYTLEMNSF